MKFSDWTGIGLGAGLLLFMYKFSQSGAAKTGDAVGDTAGNLSNAVAPWLNDVGMIGQLPELFAKWITGNKEMTYIEKTTLMERVRDDSTRRIEAIDVPTVVADMAAKNPSVIDKNKVDSTLNMFAKSGYVTAEGKLDFTKKSSGSSSSKTSILTKSNPLQAIANAQVSVTMPKASTIALPKLINTFVFKPSSNLASQGSKSSVMFTRK